METTKPPQKTKIFSPPETRHILVAGVGGTGGYLAEGLAKMIAGYRLDLRVTLADPDTVEEKNILRQNFKVWEVGTPKAKALASRLNQDYGVKFIAHDGKAQDVKGLSGFGTLLASCVDSVKARQDFAKHKHWLDLGNGLDFGQACYGTTADDKELEKENEVWEKRPLVHCLPSPYRVLGLKGAKQPPSTPSCADHPFAEQGCFINNWASLVGLNLLHQILIAGQVTTPAVWFNTGTNRVAAAKITREYLTQN